jgi:hypothetical protein
MQTAEEKRPSATSCRYFLARQLRVEKLTLFETPQRFYLVGSCGPEDRDVFYVARVDRTDIHCVNLMEETYRYTRAEVTQSMADVGAKRVCEGVGLLGFVRFLQGWYMLIIVAKRQVGKSVG